MNSKLNKLAFLMLGLLVVSGCGRGELPTMAALNDSNIRRVHSVYKIYMTGNQYRGPKSQKDLIDYLTKDNTAKVLLSRMEITPEQLPDIFVSERDNQPFKVRWGLTGVADHAIVFEVEGVEGKRLVAFSKPRELDAAEYEGYLSGKTKPQAPGDAGDIEPEKNTDSEQE